MIYSILAGIGVALALLVVFAVVRGYTRQGTVKAALDTVALLKIKSDELEKQVAVLRTTVDVLQGLVTQAAPVKELAEAQTLRHEENIQFLTRLEGSLSRLESHVILEKR